MWTNKSKPRYLHPLSLFQHTRALQNQQLYRWMAMSQWLKKKEEVLDEDWRAFRSSTEMTDLWITALTRFLSPDYPVLSSNFTECLLNSIMLYPLVGTLHDECCNSVLLGKEYLVFGGERDVGIVQPSTTSLHLAVILKETKLYLPCRKFWALF